MRFRLVEKEEKQKNVYLYKGSFYDTFWNYIGELKEPIETTAVSLSQAVNNIGYRIVEKAQEDKNNHILDNYSGNRVNIDSDKVKIIPINKVPIVSRNKKQRTIPKNKDNNSKQRAMTNNNKNKLIKYSDNPEYNIPDESDLNLED